MGEGVDHASMSRRLEHRTDRARRLRRDATDAERALWPRLRNRQIGGAKFVRQCPVGPFVVDFLCRETKLIVEIDGGQHSADADRQRTRFLAARGYTVVRFWNNDVLANTDGVVEAIAQALQQRPLSPRGRGSG